MYRNVVAIKLESKQAKSPARGVGSRMKRMMTVSINRSALLAATLLAAACTVAPEPLTLAERTQLAKADLGRLFQDQEPVSRNVTLYEAIARALKYNLDHKVALMEQAVARGDHDLSKYSFLPDVNTEAGITNRDKISASSSKSVATQQQSLETSQSSDRTSKVASIDATWNILDFGVSYYAAKQSADQVLVQEERRRKAIQNIIQDVRSAYWRAVAAERFITRIDRVLKVIDGALAEAEKIEQSGLQQPVEALSLQRRLLESRQDLQLASRRLQIVRTELSALMNLRPGIRYTLAVPSNTEPGLPDLAKRLPGLEQNAFLTRPEINQERYQKRIAVADVKKEILRMLPGIELNAAARYDSNSFMLHNDWLQVGSLVTYNLVDLVAGPARIDVAETRQALADTRRMAINMAVLTQVNVAHQGYNLSKADFVIVKQLADVNERLLDQVSAQRQSGTGDELSLAEAEAEAVLSSVERALAYADLQEAFGRVLNASGVHPLPDMIAAADINTASKAIETYLEAIESGDLPLAALDGANETAGNNEPAAATLARGGAQGGKSQTEDVSPFTLAGLDMVAPNDVSGTTAGTEENEGEGFWSFLQREANAEELHAEKAEAAP